MMEANLVNQIVDAFSSHVANVALEKLGQVLEAKIREVIASCDLVDSSELHTKINEALDNYDFSEPINEAIENCDIDRKVERAMENIDLEDAVRDAVQNLSFTVTVD